MLKALNSKYFVFSASITARNLRLFSTFNDSTYRNEKVVLNKDGDVLICWHPEPEFPYELSKPLPEVKEANADSTLKLTYEESIKSVHKKVHPYFEIKKLQEITFTNKHIWFPRPEDKLVKLKEKDPKEREYL